MLHQILPHLRLRVNRRVAARGRCRNGDLMYKTIRAAVAEDFEAVNRFILDQLRSNVSLVENIGQYLVDAGGKRLRPVTVLLSARACNEKNNPDVIALAAVIEFIHTATLLHDDVVDMSTMRRGRPTANEQWNSPSSVLVGDFIYSRAFQILVSLGNMEIMKVIADTTNTIAEGEVRQLLNKHRVDITENEYLQVIHEKTAILFEAAAQCGAILSGASDARIDALKSAGHHIGMAFQLIDDTLDYSGDSEAMGKNIGDDLAEGKPTLPLIHAMSHSNSQDATMIQRCIEHGGAQELENVIRIIQASGALEYTRDLARQQVNSALTHLEFLPDSPYRNALQQMAELAVSRNH